MGKCFLLSSLCLLLDLSLCRFCHNCLSNHFVHGLFSAKTFTWQSGLEVKGPVKQYNYMLVFNVLT